MNLKAAATLDRALTYYERTQQFAVDCLHATPEERATARDELVQCAAIRAAHESVAPA